MAPLSTAPVNNAPYGQTTHDHGQPTTMCVPNSSATVVHATPKITAPITAPLMLNARLMTDGRQSDPGL